MPIKRETVTATDFLRKKINTDTTAGITSQAAVEAVGNRYDLVLIASQRVRELNSGHRPRLNSNHGSLITAMREIEEGLVGRDYLLRGAGRNKKPRYKD